MKRWVIFGLVLLILISSGCVGESQQIFVCPNGDTVSNPDLCPKETAAPATTAPPTTTPPTSLSPTTPPPTTLPPTTALSTTTTLPPTTIPPVTTAPPTTTPPITASDVASKFKVLTKNDVSGSYLVALSEDGDSESAEDSYTVGFVTSTKGFVNTIYRYKTIEEADDRLSIVKENLQNSPGIDIVPGENVGGDSIYYIKTSDGKYLPGVWFTSRNYLSFIAFVHEAPISDVYPYARILEKRLSTDETIIPPKVDYVPKTTSPPATTPPTKEMAYLDFGFGTIIDNWDADADDDGIKTTIYPHSSDDGDVKLDATVIFTLYQTKTEFNPVTYELEETTVKLQEWEISITKEEGGFSGIKVRLEFNSNTENIVKNEDFFIGELRAKLITLDGKTFEAKTSVM